MNKQAWQITKISLHSMAASMLSFLSGKRNTQKLSFTVFGTVIAVLLGFCILAVLSFFFIMFFLLALFISTSGGGRINIYFEAVFTGTLIFSLMGSILASQSYLFEASDNELLFSMPIEPSVILVSSATWGWNVSAVSIWNEDTSQTIISSFRLTSDASEKG